MSVVPESPAIGLRGTGGELVLVSVRVDSRLLEDILEALASADFPINPEIRHGYPDTSVEFPAYESQLVEIRRLITRAGAGSVQLHVEGMLGVIA